MRVDDDVDGALFGRDGVAGLDVAAQPEPIGEQPLRQVVVPLSAHSRSRSEPEQELDQESLRRAISRTEAQGVHAVNGNECELNASSERYSLGGAVALNGGQR